MTNEYIPFLSKIKEISEAYRDRIYIPYDICGDVKPGQVF